MGRKPTFKSSDLRRLHARRFNDTAIARVLGVKPGAVKARRHRLGLPGYRGGTRGRAPKLFTDAQFRRLYEKGLFDTQIARILDVAHSTVSARRNVLELPVHPGKGRPR